MADNDAVLQREKRIRFHRQVQDAGWANPWKMFFGFWRIPMCGCERPNKSMCFSGLWLRSKVGFGSFYIFYICGCGNSTGSFPTPRNQTSPQPQTLERVLGLRFFWASAHSHQSGSVTKTVLVRRGNGFCCDGDNGPIVKMATQIGAVMTGDR